MTERTLLVEKPREQWSSRMLTVLAAVGSAVGLGNIWMFPWRMGAYGGSAFLLIYVFIVIFIGVVALMGEFALGREQQRGPIGALDAIFRQRNLRGGKWWGLVPVLTTWAVTVFYMVVVGWIAHYFIISFRGFGGVNLDATFRGFVGTPYALIAHVIAIVICGGIVYAGVKKGLEPICRYMTPALFVILIILVIRAVTLPGADAGIRFMFAPDFPKLIDPNTWFHALTQVLFSLSVFGSIMVVYGSYIPKGSDVPMMAYHTAFFDTAAAILAAFIVFPTAFAFGVMPGAGIPLMFITLPGLFGLMPAGTLFGALFFLLVLFAAITSAISIIEAGVEPAMNLFKWGRKKAALIVSAATLIVGIPLTVNMAWFTHWLRFTSLVLMPIGVLVVMIAYFWLHGSSRARKEINDGASMQFGLWLEFFAKYVVIGATLFITVVGTGRFFHIW